MKHLLKLSLISLITFLLSCKDEPKADSRCHQYYLVKEKNVNRAGSQFFYNSDGLLSVLYYADYDQLRIEFVYDGNKNLTRINYSDAHIIFNFPDANSLCAAERDNVGHRIDSIAVSFDNKGRVSKLSEYFGTPWQLSRYYTMEYIGPNTVKTSGYESNELTYTGTAIFDNHPTPYPKEYDYFLLAQGFTVSPSNVLSFIDGTDSFKYDYNADGYPTRYSINNGPYLSSFVYSCEPVHE